MDDAVVRTVRNARKIGEEQFNLFIKERFIDRSKPLTYPLRKNNVFIEHSEQEDRLERQGESGSFEGRLFSVFEAVHSLSNPGWKLRRFLQI